MARLSTEHYRDKSDGSNSIGKRFGLLFKSRKSLEDPSSSTNTNGNNKLLKPGFEKHAQRPSITLRPSFAPPGEMKKIPHAIDTNLEPAATKTTPTCATEFERLAPLWVDADKVLVQAKKDGDDGGLQYIQEEGNTGADDPSISSGTKNLTTLDNIVYTPIINKALRTLGNPQSTEAPESSAKNNKIDVPVNPVDSVSIASSTEDATRKTNIKGPRRDSSVRTASSWATACGPNSADVAERLGLTDVSLKIPDAPGADVIYTIHLAASIMFLALLLVLTVTLSLKKAFLMVVCAGILSASFYFVLGKLFESRMDVTHPVRGMVTQVIWACVPLVNWIAFHTGYMVAPIVEALVEGFATGYERALLDH